MKATIRPGYKSSRLNVLTFHVVKDDIARKVTNFVFIMTYTDALIALERGIQKKQLLN